MHEPGTSAVVEWYVNSARGLEQGFTLYERPDGEGPLVLELALGGSLLARTAQGGRGIDLHAAGSPLAALSYGGLAVEDANGRQLEAHLELRGGGGGDGTRLRIVVDDSDAAYPLAIDPLIATAASSSAEVLSTHAAAWGDMNADGALELALGSWAGQNRVYMSTAKILDQICWSSPDTQKTVSLAWGDWDGDGDLDLAAGNEDQGVQVFANVGGTLTSPPSWTSSETDKPFGLAWGDWDGDGDLDLAAGNAGFDRVYDNSGGTLSSTSVWASPFWETTNSVSWGDWDGDGDLDLAAGVIGANRVYENSGGALTSVWTSTESDATTSVAWGDVDGDGDLDLAVSNSNGPNRVYSNGFLNRPGGLPETPTSAVLAGRPGGTAAAPFGFSSAGFNRPPVTIPYTLFDEQSDPAWRIVPEYSLAGGGQWLPATGAGSPTTNLVASPGGTQHEFVWDAAADGVVHEPNVAFRISVLWQAPDRVGGFIQRGRMAAVSPPFMAGDAYLFADGFESGSTVAWSLTAP